MLSLFILKHLQMYHFCAQIFFSFFTLARGPAHDSWSMGPPSVYVNCNIPRNFLKIKSLKSGIPLRSATGLYTSAWLNNTTNTCNSSETFDRPHLTNWICQEENCCGIAWIPVLIMICLEHAISTQMLVRLCTSFVHRLCVVLWTKAYSY